MEARPHPKLRLAKHGTHFPAQLSSLDGALPRLPAGFAFDTYPDAHGAMHPPE